MYSLSRRHILCIESRLGHMDIDHMCMGHMYMDHMYTEHEHIDRGTLGVSAHWHMCAFCVWINSVYAGRSDSLEQRQSTEFCPHQTCIHWIEEAASRL